MDITLTRMYDCDNTWIHEKNCDGYPIKILLKKNDFKFVILLRVPHLTTQLKFRQIFSCFCMEVPFATYSHGK